MGRARGKGSGARKAKKAANDREETKKFFNRGGLGPPPKETRRARAAPAPKLDQFAGKRFVKDDKKHTAVVDAAIAAARKAGHRESKELFPYVWNATRFARKDYRGRHIHHDLTAYVSSQCAEEDRSKQTPWWYGLTDIVKAKDEDLLKFVKRKDVVFAVESCCGKMTEYGEDSGLRRRAAIAFSVDEHGLDGATRRARLETYKALGLRVKKFLKQLQKLK